MDNSKLNLSTAVHEAFASLVADNSLFALPFAWIDNTLHTLPPVQSNDSTTSFQNELNKLDAVLNPRTPLYLILRRKGSLVAVTFVPYLAKDAQRNFFLENRLDFVRQLGEEHFSQLLICKEIGEITDARSWIEREENGSLPDSASKHTKDTGTCDEEGCAECAVKDVGYKRNKCRLCDRRMKNKISPEALEAFKLLVSPGATIQISVDITTETLTLNLTKEHLAPEIIAPLLPTTHPTFTFFHHPDTSLIYFIFHSPDTATVQQRMKHTMAIPGLLVHAEDAGITVDRKLEIHEPEELVFEEEDERVGRFRSMYVRKGYKGTELMYEGSERDRGFVDALG